MAKSPSLQTSTALSMKPSPPTTTVELASLDWDADGQPLSSVFGDVYFSKANGLEETRHVFLKHNQLPERWAALGDSAHFTIAETGFGSGLNFLAAWALWLTTAPESAQLHFVTVEKFPLNKVDLARALALWPELKPLADQLVDAYPVFVGTGFHRLNFMSGRIKLTLIIDDAEQGLTKLLASTHPLYAHSGAKVDAWFLDGFAPSKNPQMWSDELFNCIRDLSKTGTTAATFSAAAIVKNGLKNAGFAIQKVTGFGRKREMVKAQFTAEPEPLDPDDYRYRGSFSPYPVPWTIDANKSEFSKKRALIIGGGLAGCHSARALAERGWQVKILERHAELTQEGSGNPQGVLYAKLSPLDEAQAAFNLASLQYALNFYRPLWKNIGDQCGVLQLAYKNSEAELHELLTAKFANADPLVEFVSAEKASQLAGISLTQSGLFFPQAGWIDPRKLCAHLVDHPNIQVEYNFHVSQLNQAENNWQVESATSGIERAPVVIIASAKDALHFTQANHLPIKSIRGQITFIAENAVKASLKTVVCAEGYISPAQDDVFCTGATFNLKDTETATRTSDHQTNLDNLREHLPALEMEANAEELTGRVAFRCSLPDYLPCVGALPVVDKLVEDFAPLRKNARAGITTSGSYWHGLYINIGHGARGLTYTPLCAELLAAHINNEPIPMPRELVNALNPARFVIRDLIRNKR
jgi:tRNA 5-methylaminomethyl-2-thiouridine biosynthesis bifunctional protein